MRNAELIFNAQLMRTDERRVSGSTGVHAALLAPSGAVRAAGSTRRRQYAPQAVAATAAVRAFTPVQFTIHNSQFSINAECRMQN